MDTKNEVLLYFISLLIYREATEKEKPLWRVHKVIVLYFFGLPNLTTKLKQNLANHLLVINRVLFSQTSFLTFRYFFNVISRSVLPCAMLSTLRHLEITNG